MHQEMGSGAHLTLPETPACLVVWAPARARLLSDVSLSPLLLLLWC